MSGAEASPPLLRVEGVRHSFRKQTALDGLSFTVGAGESLGLLGPNGSGKSTMLALLGGQLRLQAGSVEIDGAALSTRGAGWRAWAQRVGVVFQSPALDPVLGVRRNLELAAQMYGFRGEDARSRVARALAEAGLEERAADSVRALSGGMRRRLDLARALLHEPDVLLLDEPTTGLDESSFRDFWARVERVRVSRPLTIVVATHRAGEAERCDRVAILDAGRALRVDSPAALRAELDADVVTVEHEDAAAQVEAVRELAQGASALSVLDVLHEAGADRLHVTSARGAELIPALVAALDARGLRSVSLRQPTLADVFLRVSGRSLEADASAAREAA